MTLAAASFAILAFLADGARVAKRRSGNCGVLGLASSASGPNASIVNGKPAAECNWKWQVGLKWKKSGEIWCGGMLIDSKWVLTAAHCVDDAEQGEVWVVAGEHNLKQTSGKEQNIRSRRHHIHPNFNARTLNNDIALIELRKPMQLNGCVGTVCLPSSDVSPGTECWITGWGTLSSGGKDPTILQEAKVTVLSNEECRKTGYKPKEIKEKMLCAQGRNQNGGITDACQGDSGGPLVCSKNGRWTVYGATSWGNGCAEKIHPGVWARVHKFVDWIESIMG